MDRDAATEFLAASAHIGQAATAGIRDLIVLKADAIIADGDTETKLEETNPDGGLVGVGVASEVADGFLQATQQREPGRGITE